MYNTNKIKIKNENKIRFYFILFFLFDIIDFI